MPLSDDRLLRALLESAPARNPDMERFLTAVRSLVMRLADQTEATGALDEPTLAFACALARQCFINEYVFAATDTDLAQALRCATGSTGAGRRRAPASDLARGARLLRSAACTRAGLVPDATAMAGRADRMLVQQVQEPAIERDLAAAIPALTAIDDAVSVKVRNQYEEMPYPRWVKPSSVGQPIRLDWYLRSQFPGAPIRPAQHAADGLRRADRRLRHRSARDRDRAALRRRARAGHRPQPGEPRLCGAQDARGAAAQHRIYAGRYPQSRLAQRALRSDRERAACCITCAIPQQGWRVLVSLLRPGGFMQIGLYSALARADIRAARALHRRARLWRHRRRHPPLPAGAAGVSRTARRSRTSPATPISSPPANAATCCSMCRSTSSRSRRSRTSSTTTGLTFLGFAGPAAQAYRARFPDDPAMTDLDRWHAFETENPMAFVNMYQFWVQKR